MNPIVKKKVRFIALISSLVFSLALGIGATISWFDDASTQQTVDPGTLMTNGLQTDALVYSGNGTHSKDDATAKTATADEGGTYGYDHSQTGKATSYYLMLDRDGDETVSLTSGDSLQMFTNLYNASDEACYFKLSLKAGDCFKIYNSDLAGGMAESWFGYDKIQEGNPANFASSFGIAWPFEEDSAVHHNIRVKSGAPTNVYDIYYDDYTGIWIDLHIDETRSKATSSSTGYYIIGSSAASGSGTFSTPWSLAGGYAMYVDSENYGTNKGVYRGLYLEPGDIFKISTKPDATGEWHGYLNFDTGCAAASCFENDGSVDNNIRCKTTGYYDIYLNNGAVTNVSIVKYTGGYSTAGGSYTAKSKISRGGPTRKNAAKKTTNAIYWRKSESESGNWGYLYSFGGNENNGGWPGTNGGDTGGGRGYIGDDNKLIIHNNNGQQTRDTSKSGTTVFYHHNENQSASASPVTTFALTLHYGGNSQNFSYTKGTGFTYTTPVLPSGTELYFSASGYRNETNPGLDSSTISTVVSDRGWGNIFESYGGGTFSNNFILKGNYKLTISMTEEAYGSYGNWLYGTTIVIAETQYNWSVSYDANEGSFTGTNPTSVSNTSNTVSFTPDYTHISKNGYTFAGWKYNGSTYSSGTISLTGGTSQGAAAAITLVAQWTPKQTTVTLNNQGATTPGTTSVTATYGAALSNIAIPAKTGYTFGGYFTEAGGAGTQYYLANGTSAMNWDITDATKTLYAKWTAKVRSITLDRQSGSGGDGSVTATYGAGLPNINVPSRDGFTFGGYFTEPDGAGTQYYSSNGTFLSANVSQSDINNLVVTESSMTLYAKWTELIYKYYLSGSMNGWNRTEGGSYEKAVGSQSSPGTWNNISFSAGDEFKIFRDNSAVSGEWGWSNVTSASKAYVDAGSENNNIKIKNGLGGSYDVSLDISSNEITVIRSTYKLYQYSGNTQAEGFPKTANLDSSGNATFSNVNLIQGNKWHIESDGVAGDAWGWNTTPNATDHIQATTHYAAYFADGGAQKGNVSAIHNIENKLALTGTVVFNKNQNTITVTVSSITTTFSLKESNAVGSDSSYPNARGTTTANKDSATVTTSNAALKSGFNYYLEQTAGSGKNWSNFYVGGSFPTMTYGSGNTTISDPSKYFYSSTASTNIGVKLGGQYDFTYDLVTNKFTSVHLDSLLTSDFLLIVDGDSNSFTSSSEFVWTKTSLHLGIGSTLYAKSDNTDSTNYLSFTIGNGLTADYGSYSNYFTADNGNIKSLVDCTVSLTFTFNPANATAAIAITDFTKNDVTMNHWKNSQIESGMYWVNNGSSYACDGAGATRMFYGTAENASCRYAYSGLIVSNENTIYKLREAYLAEGSSYTHLYEHQSAQMLLVFSNNGTDFGNSGSQDDGYFVKFTQPGTFDVLIYYENSQWTIEAKLTGKTVDVSQEHAGKWSVIGKGAASNSALYDCDFTTRRCLPMYCAKDIADPYPCYAGAMGGNGDTVNNKGNAIILTAGDQLALNTSNGLMTPTADASHFTISGSIAKITHSGYYKVYATGSTFTIEYVSDLDGRNGTDKSLEDSESPSPYGAPASYTKMDGARVKRASGSSLSFATGIDASLMDATGGYIKIFVELRPINKSGKNGSLSAVLSNVTAPENTKYTVKTYSNAATPVPSAIGNIASLRNPSTKIDNQNFANGSMYSSLTVNYLNSEFFSVATIIEIDVPLASLTLSGASATFNLQFNIALTYSEA